MGRRGTRTHHAFGGNGGRLVAVALALVGCFGLLATSAAAAPGDLDPSFSEDGKVVAYYDYYRLRELGLSDLGLQADGSIVAAGDVGLVRFNPDGTPDDSFFTESDDSRSLAAVALQPDGKIVVAGYDWDYWTGGDFTVARYQPDGGLDDTFSGNGIATMDFGGGDDGAKALAVQPDGKIVVAGYSVELDGDDVPARDLAVARYNPNGTLDTGFSGDGKRTTDFADDTAYDVAVQADGKIVVSGSASGDFALVRYEQDGSLDDAFSGDGRVKVGFTDSRAAGARAIAVQPDGKIVAAGGTSGDFALVRAEPDGSLDGTFGGDGVVTTSFGEDGGYSRGAAASDVVLESGRLLAAGRANGDFALARYGLDGDLDAGFSGDGMLTTDMRYSDAASSIAVQPDGGIVVGGSAYFSDGISFEESYGALARYLASDGPADADADGVLDSGDLCPQVFAPEKSDGCPRFRRTVSLYLYLSDRYRAFAGELTGPWGCIEGSRVRIFKIKRGGRTVKVASATAYYGDREGDNYWIPTQRTRGRYYAKIKRELRPDVGWCSAARSDVLRLRRR
jgi:uncharacterized delta-60 repeat protein